MSIITTLQKKIGAVPDGYFGRETAKAFRDYYRLTNEEAAMFLGQCYVESNGFTTYSENLNYSAKGLLTTFGRRFKSLDEARRYARRPQMIANRVYANKGGNGDEASGDGWKYRGRFAIQLTLKDNYIAFAKYMNDSRIIDDPDTVEEEYFIEGGLFYFNANRLFCYCKVINDASIELVTGKINIAKLHLDRRKEKVVRFYSWLTT